MYKREPNLNNKTLRQFVEGDTLYIARMRSGYQHIYLCKFKRLEKGIVIAEILDVDESYMKHEIGNEIKSRAYRCCLWGHRDSREKWDYINWFYSLDTPAGIRKGETNV